MRARSVYSFVLATLMLSVCATSVWTSGSIQLVSAAAPGTLAENLNSIIANVNWTYGDSWTANWAMILANRGSSAFDNAMTQDINRGNYSDALYVARLAQLNGYASDAISQGTLTALQQISMCGSLPITANAHSYGDPDILNNGCFLVYDRFALWAYQYASTYGLSSKWNATQAFMDFAKAYDAKPTGSVSGEMLWCDPQENWAASYSSRYYDEHAETLSTFLQFAEQGVPEAMRYADRAWAGVQAHWNGQYYGYAGTSVVECEMGNFAQIIAEYKDQKGSTIPYWDRVIFDLSYKLVANSWSSPGWASPGVLVHATTNSQLRLWETMGAVIALQQLFPDFNSTMKTSWANMLMGSSPAWQGLVASSLNKNGYFSGVGGSAPTNDATACAAATLFLYGIVPVTGSLAIQSREECYNDLRTQFATSDFKFDYANRLIRIPVHAGKMTFIYGSTPVSYTFPTDGVYTIKFSDDWNLITSVNDQNACLVVRGGDNRIYYRVYNSTTASWYGWNSLPTGITQDSPAAAVIGNELHIVVRGMDYGQIWHGYLNLNDNTFSSWTLLSGATPSSPTMTGNSTHLCLVVRGNNNIIYYRFYTQATRAWTDWTAVPGGTTLTTPAATLTGSTLQVVVEGSNYNQIWHGYVSLPAGTFSGWTQLSGATPSPPTLTSNSTSLCLVVRGNNNNIYYRWYDLASETWTDWTSFPYGTTPDTPAATMTGNRLQIVVRGSNYDQIWYGNLQLSTNIWSGWTQLDGSTPSKPILTS